MKAFTSKTHSAIIYDKKCGHSGRTIAKNLGCNILFKNPISAFTIRRTLKKVGLSARIPHHKLAMTEAYCQIRLEWARVHEKWITRQ
ncbi:16167_t:CDS:2 [Funneliformis geosporum]|uniref:11487_t:CDS:1 n=1 Tax=Funneliformis geosporum TaxID=1117311 RepID=A0A9W4T2S1_9GLOM|nr:16167_t:CDS:2 [Funneliformis geosporum]CAI2190645.1 11487_t:CDS:2 [Funneliformis geosporum]